MHKINQSDLARILNTTQQQISKYETGTRELRESQIVAICREFHVSADFLLGITPPDCGSGNQADADSKSEV